ncbi:MAG: hypothetical protein LBC04_01420 [Holosporaceae bacterium]|nr:hypothetical protein [Holosporaceae bacterium]
MESFQEEHNVLVDEAFAAMSRSEQIPLQIVAIMRLISAYIINRATRLLKNTY